jgi:hypothetical protein
MPDIKDQKLLYHLTSLENIVSILQRGLLPRAQLESFADVANPEIIQNRGNYGLERFVPFHWFARNPFDGRVQQDHPRKTYVLIAVRRTLAQAENWPVIPRHPLANGEPQLLNYQQGVSSIDWETMNRRDYHDSDCKSVCMAECLSPRPVQASDFFRIYAPTEEVAQQVRAIVDRLRLHVEVDVNPGMFIQ